MQTYVMNEIRTEGIEQTRDEAKSAYAITFPLPTMAVLCSRTYITTGK